MKFFYSFKEAIRYSNKSTFFLSFRSVFFPVFLDNKGTEKWVVFLPGACSREKPMPIFQRSSYSEILESNVISLFDPGLLLNKNLTNTWFCGTPARYYADYISRLLKEFFNEIGVRNNNILLFGTSAGGLPALKIAQRLPGCTVWAGNIQTIAYKHSAFQKMIPVLYPNQSHEECINRFSERFDARQMDGSYKLIYFQNKSDRFHHKNHYIPYKKWWQSLDDKGVDVDFFEYDDPISGHGPVGRVREIELINNILSSQEVNVDWAQRA